MKNGNWGQALTKAMLHGISRSAITKLQGGRWSSGFWSGFASSFFSPGTKLGGEGAEGITLRTVIAGTIGGTVSEITGGKFANGAVTGAFVHLFNAEAGRILKNFVKYFKSTKVDNIIEGATKSPKHSSTLVQYEKNGGYNQALKDFDSLSLDQVESFTTKFGTGKKGILEDGTYVTVRPSSTNDLPTLQFTNSKRSIKVRYNNLESGRIEPVLGLF